MQLSTLVRGLLLVALTFLFACGSSKKAAQVPPPTTPPAATTKKAPTKPRSKNGIKPFEEVITKEAKSDEGLFNVHWVGEKLYFEIPDSLLSTDLLLVSRIEGRPRDLSPYTPAGSKANTQVVQWQRQRSKVLLRVMSYNSVADEELPIYQSVRDNNFEPVLSSFPIKAFGQDSTSIVIDVTDLFMSDVPAIGGLSSGNRSRFRVRGIDKQRSFIDTARSFPINVEVTHTQTFRAGDPPADSRTQTISLRMNQSMILLPKDPMMPRIADERVGWFTVEQVNYGSDALKADKVEYIRRWRLVPKDMEAYRRGELVEPVKPIVYYLDPATPEKWRPYFKQGIEDWNDVFEAAGFRNAIIAKDPPTPEEDPEFDPEDARYSTVRYVASETRNAQGPSTSDPRTGEIIESDIIWYHNHLRSYRNRYLLETGAANPKARSLNTPEEEIGEMMRRVISHEIGHALGLPHNFKSNAAYPVDSLRSGSFTQQYGIAATIMDYARYNYIAQPGDKNIRFIRQLGPYDYYSINWGYRYLPDADSPEAERDSLHAWIVEKEGDPLYMFGSGRGGIDPDAQTECIGDDPVVASTYGIANLKRVVPNLIDWTKTDGQNWDDLGELYGELLGVWSRYVGHVVTNIGGVNETLKTTDQRGVVYQPVGYRIQEASLEWLLENAFTEPTWLMRSDIYNRITSGGSIDRIRSLQARHLGNLLDLGRLQRLIEAEAYYGEDAFGMMDLMDGLREGIWSELYAREDASVVRRNLQRTFLEGVIGLLSAEQARIPAQFRAFVVRTNVNVSQSDIRPAAKAQLRRLQADIRSRIRSRRFSDMMRYHLQDALDRIEDALDGGDGN